MAARRICRNNQAAMRKPVRHTRIPYLPFAGSLAGARLDRLQEAVRGLHRDFIVDYHELRPSAPPEIGCAGGQLFEQVRGQYVPRRLRFTGVSSLSLDPLYKKLPGLPADHPARTLFGLLAWSQGNTRELFSILANGAGGFSGLVVTAQDCVEEACPGETAPVEITRGWSPPPPLPAGLVPYPQKLHQQFGGDPVAVHLGQRVYHRRLFVGGVDIQGQQRPGVDAVLNLGEDPSAWLAKGEQHPNDRWVIRGEGSSGMTPDEIAEEAGWVIQRLSAGQRVLVHCSAGFNRSVTTCCAVLILLEGLTAEAALQRVRERHPWARPDQHHWLALQWMARKP